MGLDFLISDEFKLHFIFFFIVFRMMISRVCVCINGNMRLAMLDGDDDDDICADEE